ncbi:hypothetical protein [Bradyrhizobium sp. 169]|uniref:hypothetical protein n=1 Tax=Bradyrhizobium sp. 169 TaxID=2782640 RepID=UPI001FFA987F|nr:hypothetical protein [Bradyrhizobium sp. 169]MCK1592901.1 hypothetical protein [Bradyrhizobium sp. 169]
MGLVYEAGEKRPMPRDNHFAKRTLSGLLDRALLALSAVTTAILFAWLLYYSGYGLNLFDEGLYLNFIANPFAYALNVPPSLFGFVYHWPYQWIGGDIAVLRMANVTLTMALGWFLSFLVIRRLWTAEWSHAAVLSAGIASLALCDFLSCWLTPSYYSLTFQSLLMVMAGLLLADRPGRLRQVLAWILVGVGGWCCFMAKPTTAAAIALVVVLYVVVLRRKSLLPMLGAALIALALLVVIACLIDGGITGLVTRMVNGAAEMESLLGDGHGVSVIFRIDWLDTSRSELAVAVLVTTALLLSILMGATQNWLPSLALAAVLILTIAIALLGADPIRIELATLFLVPAFICLGAMFYRKGFVLRTQAPTSIALALIFLALPHLFALGSNLNYWHLGAMAAVFWMLAVVAFLSPLAQQGRSVSTLLPLSVLAQLLTASVVNAGLLKPWRQAKDLRAYSAVMTMPGGGKLVLSQSLHDYLATARAQARAAGLEVGIPVVDLTGLSPSLLYVLETRALGLPWLIGRRPGSNAVAVEALRLENCADLAKAWVLTEPEGPYHLDQASVTASFGAGLADYVSVATFDPPVFDGDYPNSARQFLFKPVRPAALAEQSCREARRQRPDGQKWSQW